MKRSLLLLFALAGLSAFFPACTKDPLDHLSTNESRIYITDHDSSVNFTNYKKYSISDSVAVIENGHSTHELNEAGAAYISAVKKYMGQMGFVLVPKSEKPDLGVNVNQITNTSTGVISYGDYWSDYGGYWDPYYWGYPDYGYYIPYAYSTYQIKEGAVSIDLLDLKDAASDHKINVIWTGLIRGPQIYNSSVADSQVKALFDQSPYLTNN